ncbi:MAG: hypothetical protein ACR2KD_07505 [Thermoleophilaceae bacterium]
MIEQQQILGEQAGLVPGRPGAGKMADLSFIGLDGEVVRSYDYPGGRLLAGAGLSEEGELLVGITFGPPGFFASGEAEQVFTSMSLN